MEKTEKRRTRSRIFTGIKLCFSVCFGLFASRGLLNPAGKAAALAEICVILLAAALIKKKNGILGWLLESVVLFLAGLQFVFLKFARTYLTFIMLTNIGSLEALSGKMAVYVFWVVVCLAVSFLPDWESCFSGLLLSCGLILAIACEAILVFRAPVVTPLSDYGKVLSELRSSRQLTDTISSGEEHRELFYREEIPGGIDKPADLPDRPNIVLIFTEGLSQHIVEDERNIMPNLARWEKETLFFDNYYNHSFATYRGLIGQLYSGYQLENLDENHLISLQSILRDAGYDTTFINTEPKNKDFTTYLNRMGFHEVLDDENNIGSSRSYSSDKQAYEFMKAQIEQKSQNDSPFFLAMYTFGTHVSLDSADEKYGDGKDPVLNRFYDLDVQFGSFMDFFRESECTDNTLLVFTTDHASYVDEDYVKAFPNVERLYNEVDEIPLFFYYKKIRPETVNVGGRNTLDLAPTLLDYLDISAPNCFLGTSLFSVASADTSWDTVFFYPTALVSTEEGKPKLLSEENSASFLREITEYFRLSRPSGNGSKSVDDYGNIMETEHSDAVDTQLSEDCSVMQLRYTPSAEYPNIWFAVWSAEGGEDDLNWYEGFWDESAEVWSCQINMTNHRSYGTFFIHVYTLTDNEYEKKDATSIYVTEPAFPEEYVFTEQIDEMHLKVGLKTVYDYPVVKFAVWSSEGGQDDLVWYVGQPEEQGVWTSIVDLSRHTQEGTLCVHAYDAGKASRVFLDGIEVDIN